MDLEVNSAVAMKFGETNESIDECELQVELTDDVAEQSQ